MPTSKALWSRQCAPGAGSNPNNLYQIIGVPENATFRAIRTAYRKRALRYHPDKRRKLPLTLLIRAENIWQKLSHAYEILSNKERRLRYDKHIARERRSCGQRNRRTVTTREPRRRCRPESKEAKDTSFHSEYVKQTQRQVQRLKNQQQREARSRQRNERFGQRLRQKQQRWSKKLDTDVEHWKCSVRADLVNTDDIKATFRLHMSAYESK